MDNWILARTKDGIIVKVRQNAPFSDFFIDEQGNHFSLCQIDMTIRHYEFPKVASHEEEEDSNDDGLDGYRAIYG